MSMVQLFFYFFIPLILTFLLTPAARKMAIKAGIVANENFRTIHSGSVPRLGGLAVIVSIVITVTAVWLLSPDMFTGMKLQMIALLAGTVVLLILGVLDDKHDLNCHTKLAVELLVAAGAVLSGWRIESLLLSAGWTLELGWLTWPFSILWIAAVINAVNLIDGVDGLAVSLVLIISLIIAAAAAMIGYHLILVLALVTAGASLGFVRYNLYPAKIFIGDSGTLPLGFILACLSLNATSMSRGRVVILSLILLLALPLLDTSLAIIRRVAHKKSPFTPDRLHLHHRLLNLGFSHSGTVLLLAGITLILSVFALLFVIGIKTEMNLQGV